MQAGTKSGTTDLTSISHDHSSRTIDTPIYMQKAPKLKGSIFSSPVRQKGKARPIQGQITIFCNICGRLKEETKSKRLVRDHNHKTGIIRGILCDDCNVMVGIYESLKKDYILNERLTDRARKKYLNWETQFKSRIIFHLNCNTGIRYTVKEFIPFEILIH